MNRTLLALLLTGITLTSCAPNTNNTEGIQTSGEGIIGGWEAKPTDLVQESIVAVYDTNGGQLCTGSLLPGNLVLTAAHCIGDDPEAMYIFFDTKLTQKSIRRQVDKVEISQYWETRQNADKDTGDIALVHFTGSVPAGYKPAKFLSAADKKALTKGTEVVLAGYGISNGVTEEGAGVLRVTKVKIEDPSFSDSEIKLNQTEGTGACHGDSGGPAYMVIKGHHYLWGVTSRGVQDKNNDCSQFSAYTNTLYYKSWINRAANKLARSLVINPVLAR
jgi:secreted trypsin-like serine protease